MSIGERVRKARKEKRLTQADLAAKVGIKQSTLSELENGESSSTGYIASIAAALGVAPLWLENGKGPERPSIDGNPQGDELADALLLLKLFKESTPAGRAVILNAANFSEKGASSSSGGIASNEP